MKFSLRTFEAFLAGNELSLLFVKVHDKLLTVMIVSWNRDVAEDSDDDLIHMGHAIMTFYSALIDLLGRCAPEKHVSVVQPSAALTHRYLLTPQTITPDGESLHTAF